MSKNNKKNNNLSLCGMVLFSWIIIFIFTFGSNSILVVLGMYIISALIGFFSVRYTYLMIILFMTTLFGTFWESYLTTGSMTDFPLISVLICITTQGVKKLRKVNFKIEKWILKEYIFIILIIILLSISIFVANWRYGQPIINGIMSFRYFFLLLIIPILSKYFMKNNDEFRLLENYCSVMIISSSIMVTIQLFLKDNVTFLKPFYTVRYGEYDRVLMHNLTTIYCIFYGFKFYKILMKKEKIKILDIITIVCILIVTFVTTKTRTCMIMLLAITILELFIVMRKRGKKAIMILCIIAFISIILYGMGFFDSTIQSLFKDVITEGDSYVRNAATDYYFELIENDNFWLGGGIANANFADSPINKGVEKSYFLADIGIYGLFFEYGIFGIISVIILIFYSFKKIRKIREDELKNLGFILIIFMLSTFYTISPLSISSLVAFIIVDSYINKYYYKDRFEE